MRNRRGRPPHPDILTPREWEVLSLLREGLSNEEIAERLSITERTARYHVSEILGKLGVSSRQEAARWEPEGRRAWWAVLAPVVAWRRIPHPPPGAALVSAISLALALGAGALGWGIVRATRGGDEGAPVPVATATAGPAPIVATTREPVAYTVVYVHPISQSPPQATLYQRTVDAATHAIVREETFEGEWNGAVIPPGLPSAATHFVAFGVNAVDRIVRADAPEPVQVGSIGGLPPLRGTAVDGGLVHRFEDGVILARNAQGVERERYALPLPPPLTGRQLEQIGRTTALMSTSPRISYVPAIIGVPDGRLFAFANGPGSSVITELRSGASLGLAERGVIAASLATDGYLYALLREEWLPSRDDELIKIDPDTLRIVARRTIGPDPIVNGSALIATQEGSVYLYIATLGGESRLYAVDRGTAASTLVPVPRELGLQASLGVDGRIYIYGGVGENRVSTYDPATGALEQDVSWLRAPEGTYVMAVIVR